MMTHFRTDSQTWRSLAALTVFAIGIASTIGSGGSSGSGGAPPVVTITFPPPVSSTNGNTLNVTGTASDETGVAGVSVNGIQATSSDNFATWRAADVPLTAGTITLTVSAVDTLGIADPKAATATVHVAANVSGAGVQFGNGYGVALNAGQAFVTDFDNDTLVSVNIDTGSTTGDSLIISGGATGTGAGADFDGAGGMALVNGNTEALVTNWQPDQLLIVNLVSGDRAIVSDSGIVSGSMVGMGPAIFAPIGLALIDGTSALVTNNGGSELMSVDLTSGDRTVVSAFGVNGAGPEFLQPEGVTMDTANNRALVTDSLNNLLMAVALTNGNRTVISNANALPGNPMAALPPTPAVGTGPDFDFPAGVVIDTANNRALVANSFSNVIIAVDLANGNRSIFSDNDTDQPGGTGPVLDLASGIVLDGRDSAFVVGEKLWAVELGSGDRVIVGD